MWKSISLQLPLQTTMLAMTIAAIPSVGNADTVHVSQKEFQAKLQYCETCHGLSAEGFRGRSVMPRLAGQQAEYLEDQLKAFAEHRREDRYMPGIANALTPAMRAALARSFRDLNPKPLGGAPTEATTVGKRLYESGVPGENIQPCSSCHGSDAKGGGAVPRLAGQLPEYTSKILRNWNREWRQGLTTPDIAAVMEPIAQRLSNPQIEAIAAYLSCLE